MVTEQSMARPFTEVDWYGFAGCQRWEDGTEPLLREINDQVVVVGDKNGLGAITGNDCMNCYHLPIALTPLATECFLNSIPADADHDKLIELGFQPC